MISIEQAREIILAAIHPINEPEPVALADAYGRVVAETLMCREDLPVTDNSAMDGFAVRIADCVAAPVILTVIGTAAAGAMFNGVVGKGQAVRIMTGAVIPSGTDTVVMKENTEMKDGALHIKQASRPGENIRFKGEDIHAGENVVTRGQRLDAARVGLLAACGFANVPVVRKPKLAIISTGNEVMPVSTFPLPDGKVRNSNSYSLAALIQSAGGIPAARDVVADDLDSMVAVLAGCDGYDAIITTGGVSVGDFDYVKEAFVRAGIEITFWQVSMKPGKPLVFGIKDGTMPVFGLPGNQASAVVSFEMFVRPAIKKMLAIPQPLPPMISVRMGFDYPAPRGRVTILRVMLAWENDGYTARLTGDQGSGRMKSMVGADAFVLLPAGNQPYHAGDFVPGFILEK